MTQRNQRRGLRALSRIAMAGALLVPLAGCDIEELLSVDDPEFPTEADTDDPRFLDPLIAGAIRDFQIAYGGPAPFNNDAFISVVGAFTDELYSSGSFTTRTRLDRRDLNPTSQGNATDEAYVELHQARRSLRVAAERASNADRTADAALLTALEGYTYVALGEGWCSGIPFSTVEGGDFVFGGPVPFEAVFDSAIVRFDAALALNPNLGVARIGKARALLNQGRIQEAGQAVAGVANTYAYFLERSSNTAEQNNSLYDLISVGRYSVANDEGGPGTPFGPPPANPSAAPDVEYDTDISDDTGEGLSFLLARDPRLAWTGPTRGFSTSIPKYVPLRYGGFDTDIPLASGVEARLIEAEAALAAGDVDTWLAIHNELRANVNALMAGLFPDSPTDFFGTTLAPLTDPGTADARLDVHYRERAFWLYLTGTRLGDFRRLVRVYNRPVGTVYPEGDYFKGGVYGDDRSFPVPFEESNNPNYDITTCNVNAV